MDNSKMIQEILSELLMETDENGETVLTRMVKDLIETVMETEDADVRLKGFQIIRDTVDGLPDQTIVIRYQFGEEELESSRFVEVIKEAEIILKNGKRS